MAIPKVQIGLRIEEKNWEKITYIAKKNRRSLNSQIEYLIEQEIEMYEEKHGAIPSQEE